MIDTKEKLKAHLTLTASEEAFDYQDTTTLALKIPEHFMSLIDPDDPADPLRVQVVPQVDEHMAERGVEIGRASCRERV